MLWGEVLGFNKDLLEPISNMLWRWRNLICFHERSVGSIDHRPVQIKGGLHDVPFRVLNSSRGANIIRPYAFWCWADAAGSQQELQGLKKASIQQRNTVPKNVNRNRVANLCVLKKGGEL